jgi:hypothetical protein
MPPNQTPPQIATDDPRWIVVRPSKIHLAVTVGSAALAVATVLWVPLALAVKVACLVVVAAVAVWNIVCILLKNKSAVNAFYFIEAEREPATSPADAAAPKQLVRLRYAHSGTIADAAVTAGAFVSPWLATIPYRRDDDPAWRKLLPRIVTLWGDALDAEAFRHTRVRLKWK